jgi:hypothetical protein
MRHILVSGCEFVCSWYALCYGNPSLADSPPSTTTISTAYADMSLHLDRYLRVGGLYTYYDSTIDNEQFFQEYNDALVYSDPVKDPPEVRDLVVLCKGPDKGKTGIVIGLYPDTTNNCVVKLERYRGMREIRVVPRSWAAKRLGEQDPDDVFLIPRGNQKAGGSKA